MRGILDAVLEDVENDIDEIAEILGRTRLAMADQHESHLPPQGEIRGVAEDGTNPQGFGTITDDVEVTILNNEASLVDGSNSSSLAHRLLASLQAVPRVFQAQDSTNRSTALRSRSQQDLTDAAPGELHESNVASGSTFIGAPARPVTGESHFVAAADISSVHHDMELSSRARSVSHGHELDMAADSTSTRLEGAEARLRNLLSR